MGRRETVKRMNRKRRAWERTARRCYWCDVALPFADATVDHIVPRAHGGSDAAHNLVTACGACNAHRGHVDFELYHHAAEKRRTRFTVYRDKP